MSVTIKDTNNTDKLLKTLKKLGKERIKVGVFGSDGSELVMIARVHEFGIDIHVTPKMRAWFAYSGYPLKKDKTTITIPERSFLRTGYDENVDDIYKKVKSLMPSVLEGNINSQIFMDAIGSEFAELIQKKLKKLKDPANSKMTTDRKGSDNPLIDTARLVGAIRHEVE